MRPGDPHILLQGPKHYTRLHPSYLLVTILAILPRKLVNATLFIRIFFVIIIRNKDIKKLFVLPSSQNRNNYNYHDKIHQHLPLPFNQKPRHLSLPLKLSSQRVIPVKMLKKNTMLIKESCFKPISLKFKSLRAQLNG